MSFEMGYITASGGRIMYNGYESCKIWHDGGEWNGTGSDFPGKHYGLIHYKCDNVYGAIFSKLSCESCGVYCARNEMVEGCQAVGVPIALGMFLGFLMTLAIVAIWTKWIAGPLATSVSDNIHRLKAKRRSNKEEKVRKIRSKIIELEATDRLNAQIISIAVLYVCLNVVSACDNTLYMASSGSICDNYGCKSTSMYDLTLLTGSTLCFRDKVGDMMSIKMSKSSYVYRSSKVYYTSSYNVKVDQYWECKGVGTCWNGGCNQGTKHQSVARESKPNELVGYGCSTGTLGCDTMCWYKTSCTYYRWEVIPKGQLYPVYKIMSKMLEVEVSVTYQNKTKKSVLNVNNPRLNLDGIVDGQMPLLLTGFSDQTIFLESNYLHVNGENYNIDAAAINMPSRDRVGDLQIDIMNGTISFNTDDIRCSAESCTTICSVHEPRIDRVMSNLERYPKHQGTFINNGNTLRTEVEVMGMARIMIGDVNLESLRVAKPKCRINVIGSLACTGCAIRSYVVLQASEIKEPGLIKFTSNCTFETDTISCNQEPYKLEVVSQDDRCRIFLPVLNQTLDISLDFKFLGKLDPSSPLYSSGTDIDDYISLAQNPSMWIAAAYSWLTLSVVCVIISTLSRNMPTIIAFCVAKKAVAKAEDMG
ncbi:glycoprotein precursor [Wuhan Mosquito Virus 2]|uniref:Glycoprotein n=1 Tax=Wuhan Mosquito Virus 2 TaxID=1608127 RepID=A0A0B5KU28_9VIRU|nr:glycoprotein precursor [Wuhan Mosquito Virus 2]AJG39297.1 glycoprotein precursor [Wuhan Mosquito Virus 2]